MRDLKSREWEFSGDDYYDDTPSYGEGPMDGFAVHLSESDGKFETHIQPFFQNTDDKQCKYKVSYPNEEKEDRIVDYVLGMGWIEVGVGITPFAKAIGEFIQQRFQ